MPGPDYDPRLDEPFDREEYEKAMLERELKNVAPYPWCHGAPTVAACVAAGYCKRDPNCGE